jgi:hypothetical protein
MGEASWVTPSQAPSLLSDNSRWLPKSLRGDGAFESQSIRLIVTSTSFLVIVTAGGTRLVSQREPRRRGVTVARDATTTREKSDSQTDIECRGERRGHNALQKK